MFPGNILLLADGQRESRMTAQNVSTELSFCMFVYVTHTTFYSLTTGAAAFDKKFDKGLTQVSTKPFLKIFYLICTMSPLSECVYTHLLHKGL